MMDFLQAREYFSIYQSMPAVAADIVQTICTHKKYVNIPSEKYIYVHIYVCICVYTYLCKMDERWSYASLS